MIELEKVDGDRFTLNALFIEQIQSFPDTTTITLINGILTILVVGAIVAVVIVVNFIKNDTVNEAQTIDEMNQYAYTTPEVTTDLEDGSFVRIEFEIITDGKKSLKEVEKREFQIKN